MPAGVTYDTGALIAAERGDRGLWTLHAGFLSDEILPSVSAAVLAEAWRGGAGQARLARLLATCEVEPLTEELARNVGTLIGRVGTADLTDAIVVEGATRRGDAIVTADMADLRRLANAAGATPRFYVL